MEKKVIHFKIKTIKDNEDGFIGLDVLKNFLQVAEARVGSDYHIIASPFDPSMSDSDGVFYNFDMKQLSKEDLNKIMGLDLEE